MTELRAEIARVLREHRRTTGMAVTMGWTCRCNHWCSGRNGEMPEDHWADELMKRFKIKLKGDGGADA